MDMNDLRSFVMLAETLNFTRAAEGMYVSQSTFSRQISRLEAEMGAPLFSRSSRDVALTDYGRVFLPEAKAQIAAWENTMRHMEQVRQGGRGHLTIGFLQDGPNRWFSEILMAFRKQYPDVELQFREFSQVSMAQALQERTVDVAFSFDEGISVQQDVSIKVLERSPIQAVLGAAHPLYERDVVSMKALRQYPLVLIAPEVDMVGYQDVMDRCRRAGFQPAVAATADIITSLYMLIQANVGYGLLPVSAKNFAPADLKFVPLTDCEDCIATVLSWRTDNENMCLQRFLAVADELA